MRRTLVLATAIALSVVMALPAQAANAHFVPSSWTGTLDPANGVVQVGYQVSGLGPRAAGYVRMRGSVTVDADCYNGRKFIGHFTQNQNRVAEQGGYSGKDGTYKKSFSLAPASICPPGTTPYGSTYLWSGLTMYLWEGTSPGSESAAADYFYFWCSGNTCGY